MGETFREEIQENDLDIFFDTLKKNFRSPSRYSFDINYFIGAYQKNRAALLAELIETFADSDFNTHKFDKQKIGAYQSIIEKKFLHILQEARDITETNLVNNLENIYYHLIPQFPNRDYTKGQVVKQVAINPSDEKSLRANRPQFERQVLKTFQSSRHAAGINFANIYKFSLKNCDFLRPVITKFCDQLLEDLKTLPRLPHQA